MSKDSQHLDASIQLREADQRIRYLETELLAATARLHGVEIERDYWHRLHSGLLSAVRAIANDEPDRLEIDVTGAEVV